MLFIGGFFLALAMERWHMQKRLALLIILFALRGKRQDRKSNLNRLPLILFGFMFASYLMSMWLSNSATTLIMIPNAVALIERLETLFPQSTSINSIRHTDIHQQQQQQQQQQQFLDNNQQQQFLGNSQQQHLDDNQQQQQQQHMDNRQQQQEEKPQHDTWHSVEHDNIISPFSIALMLGIAYSTNLGGIATTFGSPPNLMLVSQLEKMSDQKQTITFLQWFIFAFPLSFIFMSFLFLYFMLGFTRQAMRAIHEQTTRAYHLQQQLSLRQSQQPQQLLELSQQPQQLLQLSQLSQLPQLPLQLPVETMDVEASGTGEVIERSNDEENQTPLQQEAHSMDIDMSKFEREYGELGGVKMEEIVIFSLFAILVTLWITRDIGIGGIVGWSALFPKGFINDGTVAVFIALLLFIIPAKNIVPDHSTTVNSTSATNLGQQGRTVSHSHTTLMVWSALSKFPWDIIILFGGGFALAAGFRASGLDKLIAQQVQFLHQLPILVMIFLICAVITFVTEVTSNMATIQIFLPILAALSTATNTKPTVLMMPATISCSYAFMLPVATAPLALTFSYARGRITVKQMAKTGFLLNIFGIVLTTVYSYILVPLIL